MASTRELNHAAAKLAKALLSKDVRIVFAESCTAGLLSQVLTRAPGVSAHLCGSAVVYRVETKADWLGVPRDILDDPGPVSEVVAAAMVRGVLERTPEAQAAASITGHLGPEAPPDQDGLVFVGLCRRQNGQEPIVHQKWLEQTPPDAGDAEKKALRFRRQREAAVFVLDTLREFLTTPRSR